MEGLSKYDVVLAAWKSRFVFRTDAEYREALGASFETVEAKRESERDVDIFYTILDREVAKAMGQSLDDVVDDYLIASDVYLRLDWGDRTQLASRKKFCRMLFRLAITAGRPLSGEEIFKFKAKDIDKELLDVFFPYEVADTPVGIIAFVLLFAFGIIRPWVPGNSRGHDIEDKKTITTLKKFARLIGLLKDDTPRLGSTDKPIVFSQWGEKIDGYLSRGERLSECAPMMMLTSLLDIARGCRSLVISEEKRIEDGKFHGLFMHGIWIDDADSGRSRFWIFPDNLLAAMCFRRNGVGWEMDIYDFRVRESLNPANMDSFILLTPTGNLNYTLCTNRIIDDNQVATGSYEAFHEEDTDEITCVNFYDEPLRFPQWLNWRKWERLEHTDIRYREFRSVLSEVYDPDSPQSAIFRNTAPELSDNINNFVGLDKKYIYVYDWRPTRFMVKEKQPDVFTYEGNAPRKAASLALFELEISEKNPLYAIPINMDKRKYGSPDLDRLAEIMPDAGSNSEVYIIHSKTVKFPRLVFPVYGVSVALDMEVVSKAGILKFTHRPF